METMIWKIMQVLLNGIFVGGIYCLISVGLTMIVGVMKVVNFSQGECLTVGMYMTLVLQRITGLDPLLLIFPVALIMYLFGAGVYEFIISPIADRDKTTFTITTLGIAGIISTSLTLIFSAIPQTVESFVKTATMQIGPFAVAMPRVIAFLVMLVFVTALDLFLKRTGMGRTMRATSEIPVRGNNLATLIFADTRYYYWLLLGMMIIYIFVSFLVEKSKSGYYMRAIKADENAAESLGIETRNYKTLAFLISAAMVAMVGTVYAFYLAYIDPTAVGGTDLAIKILAITKVLTVFMQ